jgi:hypothetical protein
LKGQDRHFGGPFFGGETMAENNKSGSEKSGGRPGSEGKSGSENKSSDSKSGSKGGTQGGTREQHAEAGRQSHKND